MAWEQVLSVLLWAVVWFEVLELLHIRVSRRN